MKHLAKLLVCSIPQDCGEQLELNADHSFANKEILATLDLCIRCWLAIDRIIKAAATKKSANLPE